MIIPKEPVNKAGFLILVSSLAKGKLTSLPVLYPPKIGIT